jgi:hypothetical protein
MRSRSSGRAGERDGARGGQAEVGEDLRNDGVYLGFVCIEIFILINW